jgi:electron transport complex protein RnfG
MQAEAMRNMWRAAGVLSGFAVLGALLVAITWDSTAERIAANEQAYLLRTLAEVLPEGEYDNAVHEDAITVRDPELLGTSDPVTVYRARRGGTPVAAVLTPTAPLGYSGPVRLLVGIRADGRLSGVRVISHRETPGLGDKVEVERSDWILGFKGLSLRNPLPEDWAVQRDGGAFDQFTGATITPRAVVSAVRDALLYFRQHRDALFAAPAGADGLPAPTTGNEEQQ